MHFVNKIVHYRDFNYRITSVIFRNLMKIGNSNAHKKKEFR